MFIFIFEQDPRGHTAAAVRTSSGKWEKPFFSNHYRLLHRPLQVQHRCHGLLFCHRGNTHRQVAWRPNHPDGTLCPCVPKFSVDFRLEFVRRGGGGRVRPLPLARKPMHSTQNSPLSRLLRSSSANTRSGLESASAATGEPGGHAMPHTDVGSWEGQQVKYHNTQHETSIPPSSHLPFPLVTHVQRSINCAVRSVAGPTKNKCIRFLAF